MHCYINDIYNYTAKEIYLIYHKVVMHLILNKNRQIVIIYSIIIESQIFFLPFSYISLKVFNKKQFWKKSFKKFLYFWISSEWRITWKESDHNLKITTQVNARSRFKGIIYAISNYVMENSALYPRYFTVVSEIHNEGTNSVNINQTARKQRTIRSIRRTRSCAGPRHIPI